MKMKESQFLLIKEQLKKLAEPMLKNGYGQYLMAIATDNR